MQQAARWGNKLAMRGYFGIGVEKISKAQNLGALLRTAHAFGASFAFTLGAAFDARGVRRGDTSDAKDHLPLYVFKGLEDFLLPRGCQLVGIELTDEAIELPSFRHPLTAAYVLGPERGSLSPEMQERCAHIVKIPTRFCINVSLAGGLVMYDRMLSLGRFAPRPVGSTAPLEPVPAHVHGAQIFRTQK